MKYSKYFGAKRRGFIKSESNLGAARVILRVKISGVIIIFFASWIKRASIVKNL